MWDTNGTTNLTTTKLPRLAVVLYAVVEWLSKRGLTPNELRVWLEEMMRIDVNFQIEYWKLFLAFAMATAQMYPNNKMRSVLAMEVEPVIVTDPKFWKWEYQRLDATLGIRPTISPVTDRGGTSKIDQYFWET